MAFAAVLTLAVIVTLSATLTSYSPTHFSPLVLHRYGESALYIMADNGELEQAVQWLDDGKQGKAKSGLRKAIRDLGIKYNYELSVRTYDAAGAPTHTLSVRRGELERHVIAVTLPFSTNQYSKFCIATLRLGE